MTISSTVIITPVKSTVSITPIQQKVEVSGHIIIKDMARFELFTTEKTALIDNRIALPSQPCGSLVFNMMLVYVNNEVADEYDGVTIEEENGVFYAKLNEPKKITGMGVVSYLGKVLHDNS